MFTRMQWTSALLVAGSFIFNSGCADPNGPQKDEARVGQTSAAAKEAANETAVDLPAAKIEARTFLAAARLHESQNRLLAAIQQYEHALQADPQNAQILNRIGMLYDQIGNSASAEKAYRQALRIEPDSALIHNNLAFSYILRQRWPEAESELVRAIDLAPEFARARINLGMVLAQTYRFDDALRQFQLVLPADEAQYNIGLMYQSKRKTVEAAQAYKLALEANPKLAAAQEQLSRMPSEVLGAADRKLQELREAVGLLAAAESSADVEAEPVATTQPAMSMAEPPSAVSNSDLWPDDYLRGMMQGAIAWVPDRLARLMATVAEKIPAGRPDDMQIEARVSMLTGAPVAANVEPQADVQPKSDAKPVMFNASIASELDALLPEWQRSPELIWDLRQDPALADSADDVTEGFDRQASPLQIQLDTPDQIVGWRPLAESEQP